MRVISKRRLREYWQRHPNARGWLERWYVVTTRARWESLADVRRDYPHADAVPLGSGRTATVFNVRGNRHRLIVAVHYNTQVVYVRRLMTHAEYDKRSWIREP